MTEWDFNKTFVPRMADPRDFTEAEICEMIPWLSQTPGGIASVVNARLDFQQMKFLVETRGAIEKFERSSAKLTTRLLWLTWVLAALSLATLLAPFLMRG